MSDEDKEKSRSSHGRGDVTDITQKESWSEPNFTNSLTMRDTGQNREAPVTSQTTTAQDCTSESTEIDRVLEEALRRYSTTLSETKLVQLIRSYTSNEKSGKTRSEIRQLHRCLKDDQCDSFTRFIWHKTLDSKHKILEKQQGTPNGTPESSDDNLAKKLLIATTTRRYLMLCVSITMRPSSKLQNQKL